MTGLRVLMLGAFAPEYSRNYVIQRGLTQNGIEVVQEVFPTTMRTFQRVYQVARHFPRRGQYDVVIVPLSNQLSAPIYWLIGKLRHQPVLLDYMVGLTDTNEDRQLASGLKATAFRWIDRFNTRRMPSITDTEAHRQAYRRLLGHEMDRMSVVPIGVRDNILSFKPLSLQSTREIIVQFVGTYIPFHGVDVILRAAHLLRDTRNLSFELIGKGQTYAQSVALAQELGLPNVRFIPGYFGLSELLTMLAHGTISLGVFGDAEKTRYVIPHKVFEGLAMGFPVITAESPALNECFTPGEHLVTVPPGDPEALVAAITRLAESPPERIRLGEAGATRVRAAFLPEHIGKGLKTVIEKVCLK